MDDDLKLFELIQISSHDRTSAEDKKILVQTARQHIRRAGLGRVNQFAIQSRLQSLEERWRVTFEDDLADELAERIKELSSLEEELGYQFLPECLQFLLCLSSGKPNFDFPDHLKTARGYAENGKPLSPDDSASAESASESELWQDISYDSPGSDSVEDDKTLVSLKESQLQKPQSGHVFSDQKIYNDPLLPEKVYANTSLDLAQALELQNVIEQTAERKITECVALNESISMLCGLPSSLFESPAADRIVAASSFTLHGITKQASQKLLSNYAELGSKVRNAQVVAQNHERSPVIKMYQNCICDGLHEFYRVTSECERKLMKPDVKQHSLLRLYQEASASFKNVDALLSVLPFAQHKQPEARLFDRLIAMISEQEHTHGTPNCGSTLALIDCFERCFRVYWRPFETWLSGNNIACSRLPFTPAVHSSRIPLTCWWEAAYGLDVSAAPQFLQKHLQNIFSAGKTAIFLGKIAQSSLDQDLSTSLCSTRKVNALAKRDSLIFEPFEVRVDQMMQMEYLKTLPSVENRLLEILIERYRLVDMVRSLQMMYFSKIGSANEQAFASVFRLMDTNGEWHDRMLLTDIFQRAFKRIMPTPVERLTVSVTFDDGNMQARNNSLYKLEAIKLLYRLPEPLSNIINSTCLSAYQRIATLLFQIARARNSLNRFFGVQHHSNSRASSGYALAIKLRCNLRWFIDTINKHLSLSILPLAGNALLKHVASATNMDDLIQGFVQILTTTERRCLVADALLSTRQAIVSVLDLAIVLTDAAIVDLPDAQPSVDESDDEYNATRAPGIPLIHEIKCSELSEMYQTYKQLIIFVHASVREASRSTADATLELFASDLSLEMDSASF